jgi:alpha-tubulin suppressor-like RCC1 family protein
LIIKNLSNINIQQMALGWNHAIVIDSQRRIWSFGEDESTKLGRSYYSKACKIHPDDAILMSEFSNVIGVSCGSYTTFILTE